MMSLVLELVDFISSQVATFGLTHMNGPRKRAVFFWSWTGTFVTAALARAWAGLHHYSHSQPHSPPCNHRPPGQPWRSCGSRFFASHRSPRSPGQRGVLKGRCGSPAFSFGGWSYSGLFIGLWSGCRIPSLRGIAFRNRIVD